MAFTPTVSDLARVQNALVEKYVNQPPEELLIDEKCDPALKMIDIEKDGSGRGGFQVQMTTRGGVGPNPLFAQAGKSAAQHHMMLVPAVDLFFRPRWTQQAMLDAMDSKGSKGGFDIADTSMKREIHYARDSYAKFLEGSGWGELCRVSSNDGNFVFVTGLGTALPVPALSNRFYVNQRLVIAADPVAGAVLGADPGTIFTVTGKAPATGSITVETDLSTATVANGYSVHEFGYRPYNATTSPRQALRGFDFWLPLTAITDAADPRFQKDELQPLRFTPTGTPSLKQYLLQMDEFSFTEHLDIGTDPVLLIAPAQFRQLAEEIEGQKTVQLTRSKSDGTKYTVGVSELSIVGMRGNEVKIRPSAYNTPGVVRYGSFSERFKLKYGGDQLLNWSRKGGELFWYLEAGVTDAAAVVQPGYGADGYSRVQLVCTHPGSFVVGTAFGS